MFVVAGGGDPGPRSPSAATVKVAQITLRASGPS